MEASGSPHGIEAPHGAHHQPPEHVRTWIRKQVEDGRFASEEAVIADAVEQVMDDYRWEEDEDLLEAIAEADRGDVIPWTPELREQILRESEEAAKRGDPVSYDVTYLLGHHAASPA
jgi:Arc/MetJ-type ribon-helix-helix transcriptional regulator